MLNGEGLAVHGIRQHGLGIPGVIELQAPLESDDFRFSGKHSTISPSEEHLTCSRLDAGPIQDLGQWHARPFGRAHRSQPPLLAVDRRVEHRTTVSGAFEGDDERLGLHPVEIRQAQAQRSLHESAHVQPPRGRLEHGDLKVVADEEMGIRHDHATDQHRDRGLAIERMRPVDHESGLDRTLHGLLRID